jgi:ketosteroid isomerase-like protein
MTSDPGPRETTGTRRRVLGAVAAFALASWASVGWAHPPTIVGGAEEKATADEIIDFRKKLADAVTAKDVATLRAMYANTFQHTHTSAKVDGKDARLVALLAGEPVIENAPVEGLTIRVHAGGWAAVVFGTSPIKSLADGKVYAVRWTQMFVRAEQSWQLVASHATRAGELKP